MHYSSHGCFLTHSVYSASSPLMRSMCRVLIKKTPKVSRDLNPDIRINPDSDPDVYRIAPKMLWIYYLVGVSHFAEFVKISQWREMLINKIS